MYSLFSSIQGHRPRKDKFCALGVWLSYNMEVAVSTLQHFPKIIVFKLGLYHHHIAYFSPFSVSITYEIGYLKSKEDCLAYDSGG